PDVALVHHGRLALRQLLQHPRAAQQRQVMVGPARHRGADPLDPAARVDHHLGLDRVRLLLPRVIRLLGVVTAGPVHALLLAVDDDPDLREGGHDLGGGAELLAVAAGAVEREVSSVSSTASTARTLSWALRLCRPKRKPSNSEVG